MTEVQYREKGFVLFRIKFYDLITDLIRNIPSGIISLVGEPEMDVLLMYMPYLQSGFFDIDRFQIYFILIHLGYYMSLGQDLQ